MLLRGLLTALKFPRKRALFSLMKDGKAFLRVHFHHAALACGLVEALRRPATEEELRQRLGVVRPELFHALLDLGLALGEMTLEDGRYRAKGPVMEALQSEHGDAIGAFAEASVTYYNDVYRHLAGRLNGEPLGDYLPEIGSIVARFSRLLEPYTDPFIAKAMAGKAGMRVLDIGCGSGGTLRACAGHGRDVSGVGLEMDAAVAEEAAKNLAAWGLGQRFRVVTGDIQSPPEAIEAPFDRVMLFNVVYYFPPEGRLELYRSIKSLLAPGGGLAVCNNFQGLGKDHVAANLDVATCSIRGCHALPELQETKGLLRQAGFAEPDVFRVMPGSAVYGLLARA